jgi:tetratricopeptide (TPR) repeat protein
MNDTKVSSAHISDVTKRGNRISVREHFGVEAFGVNAFTADAGDTVITDHTEQSQRHEELYLVTSGRARFEVGSRELDAPAGTVVLVRDPLLRRKASAQEAGTTVLAVGAPRGDAYTISPWEVITDFWPLYQEKDYEAAAEILRGTRERYPDNPTIVYNLACCESLQGRTEDALGHLTEALERAPEMAQWARQDDDFASLRDDPRFDELTSRAVAAAPEPEASGENGFASAHLDDVETHEGPEDRTWVRIRKQLDVGAFGVNAYRSSGVGGQVIEEHTEEALGHQELYFVVNGRARFTVGGDEIDAPTGTFVFIGEPRTRRGARAEEPGTTVLAIGARPGTAFETSPWEDFSEALPFFRSREYDRAGQVLREGLEKHPEHPMGLYNLACCESLSGDTDAALEHLTRSIERDDRFREFARGDEDFAAIRDDPRFVSAVAGKADAGGAGA